MGFIRNFFKIKYLILVIAIILFAFIVKILFFSIPESTPYITAPVLRGDIEKTVLADGSISAFNQVSVGAQVSGQIKKIYVKLGDEVKRGDMIAEIDDLKQKNSLKQNEAALESLKAQRKAKEANLRNFQLTYERQLKLVNKGVGAQSDLDLAVANLDATKADITALDADIVRANIAVDTAKVDLGYTKITAPIDGVIVAKPVDEGQTVNSVQSAPTIVKVAQLDKMTVEAKISEADVINVEQGMPVYFTILGRPNDRFSGLTLRAIEPASDSIDSDSKSSSSQSSSTTNAVYYNGLFDVDNPDKILRISMTAQVYIVLDEAKDVLYIPSMAVQKRETDNATVLVLKESGEIDERRVVLGIDNNVNVEIKSGLNEGESVVVGGEEGKSAPTRRARVRL
ncbi:efflux RND transporter periplasmic adaptor subunit [Orbaceae bacterium ESL0721]|nr:efflux RND transporter periplasmic adaptor subunit [Orbaceae bacterium ESL0721]